MNTARGVCMGPLKRCFFGFISPSAKQQVPKVVLPNPCKFFILVATMHHNHMQSLGARMKPAGTKHWHRDGLHRSRLIVVGLMRPLCVNESWALFLWFS